MFKSSKASDASVPSDSSLCLQIANDSVVDNESINGEIGQLLELLNQKNTVISQLRFY